MTLDRLLSKHGIASRTEACGIIAKGRVRLEGRVVTDAATWVPASGAGVTLDGRPLRPARPVYLALHKPVGYICSARDRGGRPTVFDLVGPQQGHLFTAGRLDLDSSGLLLLTNDATFAEGLMQPDRKVPKTYRVAASCHLDDAALERLARGVTLDDGPTRPARVERLDDDASGRTTFLVTITEGRNRQVRRMVKAVGADVLALSRIAIGPLRLGDLPEGRCRPLTAEEVARLGQARRRRSFHP